MFLTNRFGIAIERFNIASKHLSPFILMRAGYFRPQALWPRWIYHRIIPTSLHPVSYMQSVQLEVFTLWLFFRHHHQIKSWRRICLEVTTLTMHLPSTALCQMKSSVTITGRRIMLSLLL